ncbi:hypothetical protein M5689_016323 [Euphorbia peplus]|nr:hypothetical protein M5689_016323 [Euphorbia peplus]
MKSNNENEIEILKAVAQAWLCHSGSSRKSTNEYDAYRRNFPSRAPAEPQDSSLKLPTRRMFQFQVDTGISINPCLILMKL